LHLIAIEVHHVVASWHCDVHLLVVSFYNHWSILRLRVESVTGYVLVISRIQNIIEFKDT